MSNRIFYFVKMAHQSPTALKNNRSTHSPTGMNTNALISQLKYKHALAVADNKAMSQTFMVTNESQKGFQRAVSHNLTQRSTNKSSGRMKELIVSNFIKKYVARTDPEADLSSGFYVRLTRALGEQVDRYLSEPTGTGSPGKSVKVLEDTLWDVARSLGGG